MKNKLTLKQMLVVLCCVLCLGALIVYIQFQQTPEEKHTPPIRPVPYQAYPCPLDLQKMKSVAAALKDPSKTCFLDITSNKDLLKLSSVADKLPDVKILRIVDIEDPLIPPEISLLRSLQIIVFNQLEGTLELPRELGDLSQLHELQITHTELDRIPPEIGKLSELRDLTIAENPDLEMVPLSVSQLHELRHITIDENPQLVFPESVITLDKLESVTVTRQKIKKISDGVLALKHLKQLDYSYNELQVVPPELTQQISLEKISMDYNYLSAFPGVGYLVNLTELTLTHNRLNRLPDGIENNSKLQRFIISDNQLADPTMIKLQNLTSLVALDLGNNKLTHVPPGLEKLTKLRYLRLSGNPIPQSEITTLRKIRPNIDIAF